MNYDKKLLMLYMKNILSIPSPSGYTDKVMDYIISELEKISVPYIMTNKGALVATINGSDNSCWRTLSAHVDTLGAMVKEIKDSGTLALTPVGGFMMTSIDGENCTVQTIDGKSYSGTIQTTKPSVHVSGDEARELKRVPENMEVVLDEKVFSKKDVEKLGIDVGDYICFDSRTTFTQKGFIKSRHLDDKASAAILLYAIRYIKENSIPLPHTTSFFISNYEEVGHGACAGIPENTKEFLSVDMGAPGPGQNSSEYSVCICAKDSSGPYDYGFRKKLINLCRKNNISYKVDTYPHYGSDASAALRAGWDVKAGLIGTGVFASHAYERTHEDGVMSTLDLVMKYCLSE